MAGAFNPQVGDVGLEITVDFETCDCEGKIVPLDLSPAGTIITICLRKPDQVTLKEFTASVSTCGTLANGIASFITSASDLDVPGTWCISGKAVFLDGRIFRGNAKTFEVEQPICT